jgi:hypothetical protein
MLYTAPQRGDYTRRERPLGRRGTPEEDRSNTASTGQQS